ncbi:bifunctional 2',3'-cyclic-nucleotide 2'-phosphodiesterase/3'-nucleotidase [Nioella nitratireducens]|uniref:bifunctional 2',3'-cyclic-nucleotide 2'-phosphodiesterase/3'-nucleotidase n=1 Tax=Nioella nitratireducens TaxID=1287720 RepID=UPI0008FD56B4|nr:bifunctional 2',3'-cyclic-nucleotide 2'-phosphodiesterase/3'-nucleotidase [Nioella nitratireducens]
MGTVADIADGRQNLRLTIFATTDLHANLRPYNYFTDNAGDEPALARIATLLDRLRPDVPNSLLFDNGDTLQGSPLGDVAAAPDRTGPHPMIAAMNAMGYDASTVGNHDFNFGLDFLLATVADAAFPVVATNIRRSDGGPLLPASVILDREMHDTDDRPHTLRIGVIGLAPPQITKWDRAILAGRVETFPIVESARTEAAQLRAEGADIVVALCHSGAGPEQDAPDLENALIPLARSGIADAIVAGHTHRVRAGLEGCATPVVKPGFYGSHLGRITLDLTKTTTGWTVCNALSEVLPLRDAIGPLPPAPAIMRLSEDSHHATLAHARRRIGDSLTPLETYFALVGNSPALALLAEAQAEFARAQLADHPLSDLPLLSVAPPFKAGGRAGPGFYTDIPAGALSIRHAADLYAFPNTLQVVVATGADLQDWLERAASGFNQIVPGQAGQLLVAPSFSAYNFDVIFGVTYQIDLSAAARYSADGEQVYPANSRIRALSCRGRPVAAEDRFLVVTSSYRAAGGGHFPAPARCDSVVKGSESARDVLVRHIEARSPLRIEAQPTWRFLPMPGTRVVYETGPGAMAHKATWTALGLIPDGQSDAGFQRFDLPL